MQIITEGKAKFYASKDESGKISRELDVFYNPMMKFNRDASILLLNSLDKKGLLFADIMAGSGVRTLRFILELNPGIISSIDVNDYDANFKELFLKNLVLNDIDPHIQFPKNENPKSSGSLTIRNEDANAMLINSKGFDYIDVDPFGSPNDFLESSTVLISRDGILAITGTDTAPLSGTYSDACQRKYWAKPLHNGLMHEIGLRILIRKVQLVAAQNDKALIPIYSYFKDHYNRIFFHCTKGKKKVDEILSMHKYFLHCNKCMNHNISEYNHHKCVKCGNLMQYAGPIWTGQLFDKELAAKMLALAESDSSKSEMEMSASDIRFISRIASESQLDFVGFYDIHRLCSLYEMEIVDFEKLTAEITGDGYVVSRTHFNPYGIKSNVPIDELVLAIRKLNDEKALTASEPKK